MALTVATNTGALMAQAAASSVNKEMEISMERLSTGKRINGASDDAAGVAITSRLTAEIQGTNQAIRNAMDAQSLIDTAEGGHVEVEAIMQRMRELAVQAANGSNDASDRANLQIEVDQLTSEIDRIAQTTSWAGQSLLNGTSSSLATSPTDTKDIQFQVGSGTTAADSVSVSIQALTSGALGVTGGTTAPVLSNSSYVDADADSAGRLTVDSNSITFSGEWVNADAFTFDLNGVTQTITLSNSDAFTDDVAGVSAQIKSVIDADVAAGDLPTNITTADDGNGKVTISTTASGISNLTTLKADGSASDTITHAAFSAIDADPNGDNTSTITATLSNNDQKVTFAQSGTWTAGDDIELKVNASAAAVQITLVDDDQYSNDAVGIAAQMKDALEASAQPQMVGMSYELDGSGGLTVNDGRVHAVTLENGNTIRVTGTDVADAEEFSFDIGGIEVRTILSGDAYMDNLKGVGAEIKASILSTAGLDGLDVTDNGDGSVTINNLNSVQIDNYAKTVGTMPLTRLDVDSDTNATKLTFSGTSEFIEGTVYTANINGSDVSITAVANDGYANDKDGLALQMKDAINDAGGIIGISVGVGAADSGEVTFTKDHTDLLTNAVEVLEGAGTNNTITLANTGATKSTVTLSAYSTLTDGDIFTFDVAGQTVTFVNDDNDEYENDQVGMGQQLKDLVDALNITGLTTTAGNLKVDIVAQPIVKVPEVNVIEPSVVYSNGSMSINGTIGSGDEISFSLEGTAINVTTFNSSVSDVAGQIKQAIDAAEIDGVTVTDNGDGTLGLTAGGQPIDLTTSTAAASAIETIDTALLQLNNQRANLGAITNRLNSTVNNLTNMSTNLQAGRGRIEDADFAAETTSLAKSQILQQASTAMLAQANASKQNVLSLLQG
jgi:flagellin